MGEVITPLVVKTQDTVTVSLQKETGKTCAVVQFLRALKP